MTINYANLEAIKFYPEILPSAEYVSPGVGVTSEVMNLTRLPPSLLVRLQDVGAQRDVDAELRLKVDNETFEVPAAAIPDLTEPTQFDLLASKSARLQVHGVGALANYKIWHNLFVTKATIADKLALGIPLNAEEKAINEELGINKTVDRGTLPIWDFERYKLYEYRVLYKETRSIYKDVPVAGILVDTIRPRKVGDQFVVLEKISCDTTAVGDAVKLTIARDDDGSRASPFLELNCYSMALSFDIPCFIPALRELNLWLEAGALQADYKMRFTYSVMKLSNILRMRWNLIAKEDNPDLWKRVKGGIV